MDKASELQSLIERAKAERKQLRKFVNGIKKKKRKPFEKIFREEHEEAFAQINCLDCANCCKTISPVFREKDIERLSRRSNMKPREFIDTYLRTDEEGDLVVKGSPCPFLMDDNKCSVYSDRPKACRDYPHTDQALTDEVLIMTKRNAEICPAVYRVLTGARDRLGHS